MAKRNLAIFIKQKRRAFFPFALGALFILLPIAYFSVNKPKTAQAAWWDDSYAYRQEISFTHNAALTERSVTFSLDTAELITDGVMQQDCDDTRFTDSNGNVLEYDLTGSGGTACNTTTTEYEILVQDVINGTNIVYVYYASTTAQNRESDSSGWTALTPSGGDPSITDRTNEEITEGPVAYYRFEEQDTLTCDSEITKDLSAYWRFDETVGDTCSGGEDACDLSGNGNDATWQDNATYTSAGRIDGALALDTTNDVAYAAADTSLEIAAGEGMTISTWFKTATSDNDVFLVLAYGGGNSTYIFRLAFGALRATAHDSGNRGPTGVTGSAGLRDDEWHHGVFTYDRNGNAIIYLDGEVNAQDDPTNEATGIIGDNATVYIGDTGFDGEMDDVGIWHRVLTPEEIKKLYNNGIGRTISPDYCDGSQQNNGGTAQTDTTTHPSWVSSDKCINGSCLQFDGSNDQVNIRNSYSLDLNDGLSSEFTISTWVKANSDGENSTGEIFDKGSSTYCRVDSDDGFEADLQCSLELTSGTASLNVTDAITLNRWHHVAMSWTNDGDDEFDLYIDGINVGTSTGGSGDPVTDTSALTIGGDSSNNFHGFIDEFKVYPFAKTATQTANEYEARGTSTNGIAAKFGPDNTYASNGLVGYWNFDESSGNASDSSGNDTTLTNNSTTSYSASKYGNGIEPNGSADYFEAADNATLSITGDLTLSAWIEPDDTTGQQNIVGKWDGTNNSYMLALTGDEIVMYIDSASNYQTTTSANLSSNTKYHVAGVYNSSNQTVSIYVNGILEASTATGTIPASIGDDAGEFVVGADDSPTNYFDGHIDEVRVYNRALDSSQVYALSKWAPQPVAYFPLDEGRGTVKAYDKSGNNYVGTLSSITNDSWTQGKFGSALDLDGSADYIDIGTGPGTVNTVTFWVYPETTTEYFVNLTSTSTYLSSSSGTINTTGLTGATVYVNGLESSTLTANTWQHVAIIATTAGNASNFDIGRTADANYLQGKIDDIKVYNYVRTPTQIIEDMNGGHPIGGSPIGSQTAYWKFDETYGTTANNHIDAYSSLTGSISGATWFSQKTGNCKMGSCLDFDGSNDVVTVTNANAIDFDVGLSSGFTFSAWINADSDGESNNGEIFDKGSGTFCRTDNESGGAVDLQCNLDLSTTDATVNVSGGLTIGSWHYIAVTHDGTSTINVYIDGVYRGTDTGSGTKPSDANNLLIGGDTSNNFDGTIDNFRVYGAALTENETKVDMHAGSQAALGGVFGEIEEDNLVTALNSPIAHWQFNENTGTSSTYDTSGNNHTGTLASMTADSWVLGNNKFDNMGSALEFDGSADYVDVSDSDDFSYGDSSTDSAFSVAAWIYMDDATNFPIVDKADDASVVGNTEWVFTTQASDFLAFFTVDGNVFNSYIGRRTGALTSYEGQWIHVVGTYDGEGNTNESASVKVYVNGEPSDTTDYESSPGSYVAMDNTSENLYIGTAAKDDGSFGTYADGKIDDVRVYDQELTAEQVNYIYNRGKPFGWWKFDECTGSTMYDSGSGENDGTWEDTSGSNTSAGSCTGSSSEARYNGVNGYFNAGLDFDGTDDAVDMGDVSELDGGDFTMMAWVNLDTYASDEAAIFSRWINDDRRWVFRVETDGALAMLKEVGVGDSCGGVYGGNCTKITAASVISTGSWTHVAATFQDSDNSMSFYVDGEPVSFATNETFTAGLTTSNDPLRIGRRGDNNDELNGKVDDARIYEYQLSQKQIQQIMNRGAVYFGPATGSP